MKMIHFLAKPSSLLALAIALAGTANAQIPEDALDSIFDRLNGNDYGARYDARIELQDYVAEASSPDANKKQTAVVESQLLDYLKTEPLLTTKIWILRQLALVGSEKSVPVIESYLNSKNEHLAVAAESVLAEMPVAAAQEALPAAEVPEETLPLLPEDQNKSELEEIAKNGSNRTVRFEAFAELLDASTGKAKDLLFQVLEEGPVESQVDFIDAALESGNKGIKKQLLRYLDGAPESHKIVILDALDSSDSRMESKLLAMFEDDNENLNTTIYSALGKVGSHKSLDVLLEGIDSRSRSISDAAADALARIEDKKIDRSLKRMFKSGTEDEKIMALQAMSVRAVSGTSELLTEIASDGSETDNVRKEAIEGLEVVGTIETLPILIAIVTNPDDQKIQRSAQRAIKRMTLRLADPDAAWAAFKEGLDSVAFGSDEQIALLRILDSAPTEEAIDYLVDSYGQGDEKVRATVMRVLPVWRNWDGGEAMLDIATSQADARKDGFSGVGKLILGSNLTYPIKGKFALAGKALSLANSPEERNSVIEGFRYSTWRERVWVEEREVDPELREAVLNYAVD